MDAGEQLPAAWNALSLTRQQRIISYVGDALKLASANPELGKPALDVVNRELSVLGLRLDLLSLEEFGRRMGIEQAQGAETQPQALEVQPIRGGVTANVRVHGRGGHRNPLTAR